MTASCRTRAHAHTTRGKEREIRRQIENHFAQQDTYLPSLGDCAPLGIDERAHETESALTSQQTGVV